VIDPKRHFATIDCRIAKGSLDQLVGGRELRRGQSEAEALAAFRLMKNSILSVAELANRRFCAVEDAPGAITKLTMEIRLSTCRFRHLAGALGVSTE